jgi:hypothetical protein
MTNKTKNWWTYRETEDTKALRDWTRAEKMLDKLNEDNIEMPSPWETVNMNEVNSPAHYDDGDITPIDYIERLSGT